MLKSMKKAGSEKMLLPPKTEGLKKYTSKIQEVGIKGETSWGGESPERLKIKLGKQLLSLKLQDNKLKEEGAKDWMSKLNQKSIKDQIESTREQLKSK
jgi:hypothetical protein